MSFLGNFHTRHGDATNNAHYESEMVLIAALR